jgi:nanoRNase/pAp phosphatase (c-di-AMP/oligoRNAs hydrolase)
MAPVQEQVKRRLVTRSDFDGLVCAVLLRELDLIDEIVFVHPKDMQDGLVEVGPLDITTNLPYVASAGMVFDHHHSETLRTQETPANHIIDPDAPSAARVVYEHFGGAAAFPSVSPEMMREVDRADSARYDLQEILHPEGWVLLNFVMDPRTGLGRFHDFSISNYQLMMELIAYCRDNTIADILALPDVRERVALYFSEQERHIEQLHRCSEAHENLVVVDLRNEETIHAGNRFVIYALYPECNVSLHVMWGKQQQNTVFAMGKSIINRSSSTDIGALMLAYGGGGHENAGTCQVPHGDAPRVLDQLIARVTQDG